MVQCGTPGYLVRQCWSGGVMLSPSLSKSVIEYVREEYCPPTYLTFIWMACPKGEMHVRLDILIDVIKSY